MLNQQTNAPRALTGAEKQIISMIADRLPAGQRREQLLADMENATAEVATAEGSRIVFHIKGYQRPPYHGQHSFGIEGTTTDSDGVQIQIDLHADQNNRLLELEVMRIGRGPVIAPDWASLVLY